MKKILISTDGSACSAEAIEFGVELASEHEAAWPSSMSPRPPTSVAFNGGFGMAGVMPTVPHELSAYDRASLEDAEQIAEQHGVLASCKLLVGDPVDEIVAYADLEDVDLIVIGSRGHGALASALLGSVSRRVLSESRRPVAIVRGLAAAPVA